MTTSADVFQVLDIEKVYTLRDWSSRGTDHIPLARKMRWASRVGSMEI
jgi:hypothetical protein